MKRPPIRTTAQLRAFRLLTIARLVELEDMGLGISARPVGREAALNALNVRGPKTNIIGEHTRLPAAKLIEMLRQAAAASIRDENGGQP